MNGTGSVERILVGGILVVVLAILGIAGWNATGSGDDPGSVTDGGTDAGALPVTDDARSAARKQGPLPDTAGDPPGVQEARRQKREALARHDAAQGKLLGRDLTAKAKDTASSVAGEGSDHNPAKSGAPSTAKSTGPQSVLQEWAGDAKSGMAEAAGSGVPLSKSETAEASGPKGKQKSPVAKSVPDTYTVQAGDNLWRISKTVYGDGDVQQMVDAIVSENPAIDPDHIMPGQTLKLPNLAAVPGVITPTPKQQLADGAKRLYEVQGGDSLFSIAGAELNSRGRWEEIYELNRQRISDPNVLHTGTTLILPKE